MFAPPRRSSSSSLRVFTCGPCGRRGSVVLSLVFLAASAIIVAALLLVVVVAKSEQPPSPLSSVSLSLTSNSSAKERIGIGIGDGRGISLAVVELASDGAERNTTTAAAAITTTEDDDGDNCCCSGVEKPVSNSSFFLAAAIINRIWPLDLFHMNAQHVSQWIEYHRLIGIEKFYWCDNWSSPEESTRPILEKYIDAGIVTYIEWPNTPEFSRKAFRGRQVACYDHIANSILSRSLDDNTSAAAAEESVEWLLPFDLDEYMLPLAPIQELMADEAGDSRNGSHNHGRRPHQFNATDSTQRWPSLCSDLCFVLSRYIAHLAHSFPSKKQWVFQNTLFHGGGKPEEDLLLSKFVLREQRNHNDPRTKSVAHLQHVLRLDVHKHIMAKGVDSGAIPSHIVRMNHYWGPRLQNFQFGFDDPKVTSGMAVDTSAISHAKLLEKRLKNKQQCMASKADME